MKKIISLFVALVILVTAIQPLFAIADSSNAGDAVSKMLITSQGAVIDSGASSVADGEVTFKVTLPAYGYVQLNQKLTDLFTDAEFTVATNSSAESCYLQLTADETAATDIVPVNEYASQDPGTVGMTWLIYKSGNFVVFGRGMNTNGLGSRLSTYGRFSGDGIANITFGKLSDGKVAVSAPEFTTSGIACGFTDYAPSTKTAEEVGLTNGGYFRLRNRENAEHTFTVTVKSKDVKVPKAEKNPLEDLIIASENSVVDYSASSLADGEVTFKVTLPAYGYVQYNQKLTDLFTDAEFTVATNSSASSCYLQLTADETAATDIVPVNEYASEDPGTVGMTWLIYKSGNFVVFGRGMNTNGLGSRLSTYGRFSGDGIANITFGKLSDGKVAVSAPEFTTSGIACGFTDYAPSTKTAEEVGLTDGGYFRLRNRENAEHTFTVTIKSKDVKVPEDNTISLEDLIIASENSVVDYSASSLADGEATIKVTLPAYGYLQFNQKLTDLFTDAEFTVATNSSASSCYLQLTADETAATDIVPVNEYASEDPGTVGMTWLIYKSGNFVVFGRGMNTNGLGSRLSTYGRFSGDGIANITFGKLSDGKVAVSAPEFTTSGIACGFTDYAPSTKTAEEVGLTDGGYFRLRNRENAEHTFTVTIKSKDIKETKDETISLEDLIIASENSVVDYSASSLADGEATIKVTLPAYGYLQFNQKLTDLFTDAEFTVATNSSASSCYLQLTADETAATDIVPVNEYASEDPGTVGMTWLIYKSGNFVVFGRGMNTNGLGSRLSTYGRFSGDGIANITFGKLSDGKVAVSAPEFTTSGIACGFTDYAPSTKTAEEVGLTDGGYFRLRNRENAEHTFTIKIKSKDIKVSQADDDDEPITPNPDTPLPPAPEKENSYDGKFKDYLYVSENGVVDETVTKIISGKATVKVTVAPGGYFQYLQNISDLIGGNATVNIKLGEHTRNDYTTADFHVQLTTDAAGKSDIRPVDERTTTPDNRAVSFYLLTSGHMYLGSGATTSGAKTWTWENRIFATHNDTSNGITLKFPKSADDYIQATNPRQDLINAGVAGIYTSKQKVSDIGAENGVYVRIRNNKTEAVTFTVVINSNNVQPLISPAYKDGKWILSSEDTTSISQESSLEKGVYTEKIVANIAPNGYVQLDKKLQYLISNSKANIRVVVGDGKVEDYDKARIQIQLTADEKAEYDIIPVDERTVDPGVKGMTWLFYGQTGKMWTGRGSTTANGGYYGTTNLMSTMHGGLNVVFNNEGGKVSYNTAVGGLKISGTLPSTKTLDEIGGTDGVYVRLRNAAEETVKFTITINYTEGIIEGKPITQKGWTVKGETENGAQVEDEIDEVLPGFRAWNLTIPENTYAQYNTKITDLKDAAFRYDTAEYSKVGYTTSFAFVTDPDAPWDPKTPDGNIKKFTIFIRPASDPENTHIALSTGTVISGKTNTTPTIGTLLTAVTHEGQGGFAISLVEDGGHWYLSISGIVIKGDAALEPYLRMDDFVANGAYFRIYANANGEKNMYPQVSISSKVVPPVGSDEEDGEITEDEKMLKEFLDYFTDNIDGLRKANMDVVNKVAEMWKSLSYLNRSNVEAYFLEEDDVYNLVQAIKAYASFEPTPDITEWITTYTTVYTTNYADSSDNNSTANNVVKKKVIRRKLNNGGYDFPITIIIVVSAVVVVLAAGGVTFFVIRKKRKNKVIVSE